MKYPITLVCVFSAGLMGCEIASTPTPTLKNAALNASCELAVAQEANVSASIVIATSTIPTDTGTLTTVDLLGATAPWNCRADKAGLITGIDYSEEG